MTRDDWEAYESVRYNDDVQLAMAARCEEQGHDWENCASVTFQIYQSCKWCAAKQ